ncbi:hypothetical protein DEIGR_101040 [Deinococcus grandis]|uniref:Uncharacterized protein n=3 Tax=Deinococcaceae TaxID=183710 RepID=A0A100HHU6_9DEIO|nr:hypothetical protein DEGR_22320 [Deinococcus grandis]GAQ21013.1 hypothetical protein DEIGR_101040 [Deinococcus grandis]GGN35734.1 hypothetical protein GCM10010842_15820 [Deinococcus daejeonensis]
MLYAARMEFIRRLHDLRFDTPLGILLSTPLVAACLVLFVWSLAPAIKGAVSPSFKVWLRVTWAAFLLPAVTGVLLALNGEKVASATDVGKGLSRYGYPVDPSRNGEHWMYVAFVLGSLYLIEVLMGERLVARRVGLRFLPLVTLFMYGCAFMIGRVAVLPGSTPGT